MKDRIYIQSVENKALKRARRRKEDVASTRVYYPKHMLALTRRGWQVLAHNPVSYGAPESFVMGIPRAKLEELLG